MKNNKLNGRTHASIYISSLWRVQTESQGRFAKKYKYIKQVQTKSQKHCLIAIGGASILPGLLTARASLFTAGNVSGARVKTALLFI